MSQCTLFFVVIGVVLFCKACCASTIVQVTDVYEVGQGNVAMTSQDQVINNQYVYTPYGTQKNLNHPASLPPLAGERALINQTRHPLNIQHNAFGYTGQANDPSTNLMMLGGFRHYAPGIGQFIQPDTYNSFSKQRINNTYAYVNNNPLSEIDPTGHSPWLFQVLRSAGDNLFSSVDTLVSNPIAAAGRMTRVAVRGLLDPVWAVRRTLGDGIADAMALGRGDPGAWGSLLGMAVVPEDVEGAKVEAASVSGLSEAPSGLSTRSVTPTPRTSVIRHVRFANVIDDAGLLDGSIAQRAETMTEEQALRQKLYGSFEQKCRGVIQTEEGNALGVIMESDEGRAISAEMEKDRLRRVQDAQALAARETKRLEAFKTYLIDKNARLLRSRQLYPYQVNEYAKSLARVNSERNVDAGTALALQGAGIPLPGDDFYAANAI